MTLLPLLWLSLATAVLSPNQPSSRLEFSVDASENVSSQFPGAPHLQSFSFGQWKGRWVFIGGRIAGYHSVGGGAAEFLQKDANREVWVVDTTIKPAKTYHVPLAQLPASFTPVKDQWASTAQLHFQDGAKLFICGGYGVDHAGLWLTFPIISEIDLPKLIDGVMRGQLPASSIAFTSSPIVQSAGGELIKLSGDSFYLVMGHVFTGSYTAFEGQDEHNRQSVSQEYLNEIRKLKITSGPGGALSVRLLDTYRDETEFHRRDLTVAQILSPKGVGLAVYGGVFTPDTQLSYDKPVYLFANARPEVDSGFAQKMNAYACAHLLIYDKGPETMYTTLFGGISRFAWDAVAQKFSEYPKAGSKTEANYLDGLQWSDQVSTIRRAMAPGKEETTETVHTAPLPGFLGTDAVFIPNPDLDRASPGTEILDMDALRHKRTFVGYIYGGIEAFPYRFPYNKTGAPYNAGTVPSKPSDLVLKVYVQGMPLQPVPLQPMP